MKKFHNKTALVTGATSGLGKEICQNLAENGANIVIHFNKNKKEAEILANEVNSFGVESFLIQENFSHGDLDEVCSKFIQNITSDFKSIDYLVNNAADQSLDPTDPMDETILNSIMMTNVFAPQALVKACLNQFQENSAIVNITSIEANFPFPNHSLYAASKAALTRYTELASIELAERKVRCNAVAPGLIYREGLEKSWPEGFKNWVEKAPLKRPVTASEVAKTVTFLLSDDASGITGVSVTVDGGWSVA
ncbi:MAG: hypothetical protein RLZZ37_1120 [Actinomycetota bacterium]|jgi:NAD(P)-dependent dehydrogenase (short-subunit alcohol dehydrogenase family)